MTCHPWNCAEAVEMIFIASLYWCREERLPDSFRSCLLRFLVRESSTLSNLSNVTVCIKVFFFLAVGELGKMKKALKNKIRGR